MEPFPSFRFEYSLLAQDYISKWIVIMPTRNNDAKVVVKFLGENFSLDLTGSNLSLVIRVFTLLIGV